MATAFKIGGEKTNKPTRQSEVENKLSRLMFSVEGQHLKLPVEVINPDPGQPRKKMENLEQLADSLRRNGQIQPIVVRQSESDPNRYIIVAGERRWRAAQIADFKEVEVLFRDFSNAELKKITQLQMAENRDRESLTPLEDATWHKNYVDKYFDGDQTRAAADLGVSNTYVSDRLLILKADKEVLKFADESVTRDIDTIVKLKRLYETDKKKAKVWMDNAKGDKIKGSLRRSVQELLKETKTKANTKKKPKVRKKITPKLDRVVVIDRVDKTPVVSVLLNGEEEHRFVLGKADLTRMSRDIAKVKKALQKL